MTYVGTIGECILRLKQERAKWDAQLAQGVREPDDEPLFEVKLWKRKRSLDQNSYYWALLGKLGMVLGYPSEELHGRMLRDYGVYDAFTVREGVPLAQYFRYYDVVGKGVMDGVTYYHIRAFKGSSEMDTAEFSRLLNGVIQECQQQGIETMTPAEAAQLRWVGGR